MAEVIGNDSPAPLTARQLMAAELLAQDQLGHDAIAAKVGIGVATLYRWKLLLPFKSKVAEFVAELEAAILQKGIARRARRVAALNDRWERMLRVIEARAADPEVREGRGGDTGLVVRQEKVIGSGPAAEKVVEFAVDTALLKELREHEKQAAQELGQWVQKVAPTTPDGQAPCKVYVGFDPAEDL